jgi:hypothetical protein
MFCRVNHDTHMPAPNDQIAGLWVCHSNKAFCPNVEIKGVRIRIRVASKRVHFVDQMRTVGLAFIREMIARIAPRFPNWRKESIKEMRALLSSALHLPNRG